MTTKFDKVELTGNDAAVARVLKHQADTCDRLASQADDTATRLEIAISESTETLRRAGSAIPEPMRSARTNWKRGIDTQPRSWQVILAEAEESVAGPVGLSDLLTDEEMARAEGRIALLRDEFAAKHRLDAVDWTIAGCAGVLAALLDTFLVKMPSSPGLFGTSATQGGPLSDFIRQRFRGALSERDLRELEASFPVPYDAAHSGGLATHVAGLGPRTHRFQTFGHDPILGFLFGTLDILNGSMTAVDSAGHLVRQATQDLLPGATLFEALARQLGHLSSDLGTKAGLPAPLTPILQFLQVGNIGDKGRTIGEITRLMYVKGYDFGHFLAMSICPLAIEALVRVSYAVKRLIEGHDLAECVPFSAPGAPPPPKLHTMLFVAHLVATAANAGRAYITSNPLAINYPQWIAFVRYGLGRLRWVLLDKEIAAVAHVQSDVDRGWEALNRALDGWWQQSSDSQVVRLHCPQREFGEE